VVHREPDALVGAHGGGVVGLDVQHAHGEALFREPCQPRQGHRLAEALAVEVGVDGDGVDLAHRWVAEHRVGGVGLGPAEAGEAALSLVQQEAVGDEPRFGDACRELFVGHAALLGVPGERPVVHRQERVGVGLGVGAHGQVGGSGGESAAHLEEVTPRRQPERERGRVERVVDALDPQHEAATSCGADLLDGRCEVRGRILRALRPRPPARDEAVAIALDSREGRHTRKGNVTAMGRPRTPKGRAREVHRRLALEYPDAVCELDHTNAFELLAATILSAQTTDKRVNMVTPTLFAKYPNPEALATAEQSELEEIVRSTGFYANKSKSLIGMAQRLVDAYGGEVPGAMADLTSLPGVGRKTANVVRSVALGLPGLPVDTHVGRLSLRLGLTTETDPVKVELVLNDMIPAAERGEFSLRIILHGRRVCFARTPNCGDCVLHDICPSSRV
jgi:endonuclease-3